MFKLFRQDLQRWVIPGQVAAPSAVTLALAIKLLYRYLPVRAMAWFRFGSWCNRRGIPLVPGAIQRRLYRDFGFDIVISADIAGGLYVPHTVGTVIAARRIGRNCSIIAGVTLGMRNVWEFPDIGDDVFIGAGARILGGVRVGNNAKIGANAVVIDDVPSNATAIGVPARILSTSRTCRPGQTSDATAIGAPIRILRAP